MPTNVNRYCIQTVCLESERVKEIIHDRFIIIKLVYQTYRTLLYVREIKMNHVTCAYLSKLVKGKCVPVRVLNRQYNRNDDGLSNDSISANAMD